MSEEMSRRAFLASTATLAASACAPPNEDGAQLPNIVLCMGDDHGWHETGYNGHPHVLTPVLDEMAARGIRMDRFFSAAPNCSPTRGSVMTGRHPNRYGTFSPNCSIRPEEITIAQILRDAGYACGHFGKWHLGPVKAGSPTNPGALGFEEWLSHDNFFEMDPHLSRNGEPPEVIEGESSAIVVEAANEFISRCNAAGRPFFVVVWFGSPHEPYSGIETDLAHYDDLPDSLDGETVRITSMETGQPAPHPLKQVLRARYAEITAMDRAIGMLRDHLGVEGVCDDTLLWYTSDNGAPDEAQLGSPMRAHKGAVYEGGIRVPSVVEWPSRYPEPMQTSVHGVTSDILPTLCDLTAQAVPDRPLDGISLVSAMDGDMTARPTPICFWSFGGNSTGTGEAYIEPSLQEGTTRLAKMMRGLFTRNFVNYRFDAVNPDDFAGPRAVLDTQHKLIVDGEGGGEKGASPVRELFDIRNDDGETTDRASDHPDVVERLDEHLRAWQQSVLESLTGADYS